MRFTADYEKIGAQYGRIFLWTTPKFYSPILLFYSRYAHKYLEREAGPFDAIPVAEALPVVPVIKLQA